MTPKQAADSARRARPLFFNRELSWLQFNGRVLEEAADPSNPLLERIKFATIVASNLDEFTMVRVASLKDRMKDGDHEPDPAGMSPSEQLERIGAATREMAASLQDLVRREFLPALEARGIRIVTIAQLSERDRSEAARMFRSEILPALTPLAIDSSRPFPMLANLSVNLALLLSPDDLNPAGRLAVVQLPARAVRLMRVAESGGEGTTFFWLEDLLRERIGDLFPGQEVVASALFRITRDSELDLDDEGGRSYLEALEEELRNRRRSAVVRLEIEDGCSPELAGLLIARLGVDSSEVQKIGGPIDLKALWPLVELRGFNDLREPPLRPLPPAAFPRSGAPRGLFESLDEADILLHHPYDSFDPVVSLVEQAAADPDVLAIKQTLYRTSGDSPVVRALASAAERGKQVTVLVELLARFDEDSNIRWAKSLEDAGAHVIYGIRGYKVHAKIALIVRRTRQGIRRYVHLGTGNYNDRTARLYTDFGLMTSDRVIGEDASRFFNALTGYSDPPRMKKLIMSPTALRQTLLDLIGRERRRAAAGQPAEIVAKMNSLVDREIIEALYEASSSGVRIRLNVRGICCLVPGVRGMSGSIEVVSIVDRFLEHARVFLFHNGGDPAIYLSSADWMPRNLDRRIELLFPIESPAARRRVVRALEAMFADNVKARRLLPGGAYERRTRRRGEEPYRAQLALHEESRRELEREESPGGVVFDPVASPRGD
jgi:polyphosphate kinase